MMSQKPGVWPAPFVFLASEFFDCPMGSFLTTYYCAIGVVRHPDRQTARSVFGERGRGVSLVKACDSFDTARGEEPLRAPLAACLWLAGVKKSKLSNHKAVERDGAMPRDRCVQSSP